MSLTTEEREYWESKGFTLGAEVRPTGTSWNASTSSRKWIGVVGEIVPGARPKPKGIPVQFKREDWQFPEIFVYHPTSLELKEPKMPAKPKPAPVKPVAPKPEPSLYKAIRERLETKDKETLHDRTKKAVEVVEHLLEGTQPVDVSGHLGALSGALNGAPGPAQIPWGLDGLVVDPGEDAVGQWGFFWDEDRESRVRVAKLDKCYASSATSRYQGTSGNWQHFAYTPNFPGATLLKATTGYEAPK